MTTVFFAPQRHRDRMFDKDVSAFEIATFSTKRTIDSLKCDHLPKSMTVTLLDCW
jgi:hypothetical protein